MRWNVQSTYRRKFDVHRGMAGREVEATTAVEAFVLWRRRSRFRLSGYDPGDVLVSVFPLLPSRFETEADFELLEHQRVDFDLTETSLAIMAIEASMPQKRIRRKRLTQE